MKKKKCHFCFHIGYSVVSIEAYYATIHCPGLAVYAFHAHL